MCRAAELVYMLLLYLLELETCFRRGTLLFLPLAHLLLEGAEFRRRNSNDYSSHSFICMSYQAKLSFFLSSCSYYYYYNNITAFNKLLPIIHSDDRNILLD